MTARKPCKCPGCRQLVHVTADGRLNYHARPGLTVQTPHGPESTTRRCEWSGKPAPTEGEQEAGR